MIVGVYQDETFCVLFKSQERSYWRSLKFDYPDFDSCFLDPEVDWIEEYETEGGASPVVLFPFNML